MNLEQQFQHISTLIFEAKNRAFHAVNTELVTLYWNVGEYVSKQVSAKAWCKSVVKELSDYIQHTEPSIKGFSSQNLWRMNRSGEPPIL